MNPASPQDLSQLAPWRWHDGLFGLLTGGLWSLALLALRPWLEKAWQALMDLWSRPLGLDAASLARELHPPSMGLLLATSAVVLALYVVSGRWHERLQPLRILVRGLCLVQGSACVFFLFFPAHFPYAIGQHLSNQLDMGGDFLLTLPVMLAVGWGVLHLPWHLRLLGTLLVVGYFALWLPHQVLAHAWVLRHGTALFMPVLQLCLGPLLNGWIFVAWYAWLGSLTPRVQTVPAGR